MGVQIDVYGDPRVSEIRMRERISMKSKMLGALALFTLVGALLVMQSAGSGAPNADAATGTIHALNMGTCLTTSTDAFSGDCESLDGDDWEVRDKKIQVSTLYATYAHDPKTASDEPRAILEGSDLLKIQISDPGRDKRTDVWIRGKGVDGTVTYPGGMAPIYEDGGIMLEVDGEDAIIKTSGNATLTFAGTGVSPMDINGDIKFYGCEAAAAAECSGELDDLSSLIGVDEDGSSGGRGDGSTSISPWLSVNASVPTDMQINIYAIKYETSSIENLVGGASMSDDPAPTQVQFADKEDMLVVMAKSDGDISSQNLYLMETGRFTGVYEGYLRLTDANGDGRGDGTSAADWGRVTGDATGSDDMGAAVLGVDSGPVTIEYVDSDGSTRRLRIEIDHTPPSINIDAPVHNSTGDDHTPDFHGTIEDLGSGLTQDSFRLVIDNVADEGNGPINDAIKGIDADDVEGPVAGVTYSGEYTGYTADEPFGIVGPVTLYGGLGSTSCGEQVTCHLLADEYDDGDNTGEFDDSIRLDLRANASANSPDAVTRDKEFMVDFQAFVLDQAGNIGFSDSDVANPRFINDLGSDDPNVPNVLGYYSAHVIHLDNKDPVVETSQSVTGYFGMSSGKGVADRSGIQIVFDGAIDAASIGNDTFDVELDGGSMAEVVDVNVDGKYVFLKLGAELSSDATPEVSIASGMAVEDMAGNETGSNEMSSFEVSDGISPVLTVSLSDGSGGDALTKDNITIDIDSDENLQSAPRIDVVCNSLAYGDNKDVDDHIADRAAHTSGDVSANGATEYMCGDAAFTLRQVSALSRPGNNWEYVWSKTSNDDLPDGKVTVVAYARDRSNYTGSGGTLHNWGAASAVFTLDTALKLPDLADDTQLQPTNGSEVKEARPFIFMNFSDESSAVTLDSVELNGMEIAGEFEETEMNRFVYWPMSMDLGDYELEVDASDAAGNSGSFSIEFKVSKQNDFVINLLAGWNAVSVPADPVDTAIGAVFTDPAISTVIGWDTGGWRIAVRRDGMWESNDQYATLNEITASYGYWVKSDNFVQQPVLLMGRGARDTAGKPTLISVPTEPGWNFVGVVDQDGDQTEDYFGTTLKDSSNTPITAGEYLGNSYVRAYTWDPTFSRFDVVRSSMTMTIGQGVWVYYPEGTGIAP